ncbi:uncharacterized protein LOC110933596 [Helianthus annuus]|uniref:uncharacterized protein LOC110933596 n=1 Tax=Helianthus annuus TaxID=4232 RepID=UPI000B909C32|nr:uncharacterized protein LOC110933596 [Helianthus annuus]
MGNRAGALDIEYRKRTAIKGQVIADFLAEIPDGEVIQDLVVNDMPKSSTSRQTWKLYTDGSSSGKVASAGLMLISPNEVKLMYALRFDFECSNNESEYEALLAGLRKAQSMGATRVDAYVDSLLVNNQVNETYEAKDETMAKYLAKTKEIIASFDNVTLNHVHRGRNPIADALSKLATSGMEKEVKVETLQSPSTEHREVSRSQRKNLVEAMNLIQEIYAGICGIHAGPWAIDAKIHNAGYYWPGMHEDAVLELRKLDSPNPLAKITTENAKKFLWEHIICRFGLPLYLVSDNGTQFTDRVLQDWCAELQIQQIFTSVAHPQGNGQVERANRSLLDGIKRRLGYEGSSWVEELANVLRAHRTMPKTSNSETPFSLTYGTEPAKVGLPSLRRLTTDDDNDRLLRDGLDLLEERREAAAISEEKYKKALEKYYNQRVAQQTFKEGDYVMWDNEASRAEPTGKLGPTGKALT